MEYLWIIPFSPLIAFIIIGLFGYKFLREPLSGIIAVVAVAISAVVSVIGFIKVAATGEHYNLKLFTWLPLGDYEISVSILWDPLSALMTCVVTVISTFIFIFATGYMRNEPSYPRFFAYLSLFVFMMLMLTLSDNLVQLFFGWEGVGLASYLLIGFYHHKNSAADAAFESFITNRVGDWLFLTGLLLAFVTFGTLDYIDIFNKIPEAEYWVITAIALLLFGGAVGKSAQLGLHIWLPNAMEGPTPVSALIHAATMVAAGVYMVARLMPVFAASDIALDVVLFVGTASAFIAATMGLVQNDIKRIIAYSTMSQLGYMFAAEGLGLFGEGMFHLASHAVFKALLFLAAGSVLIGIHHILNVQKMGQLRKYMPITAVTFLIGALALAGIPPFAGFFSKDPIIEGAYEISKLAWFFLWAGALLTAFYIFRLYFLVFENGDRLDPHVKEHVHESPPTMTIPLIVLASGAVVLGFFKEFFGNFLKPSLDPAQMGFLSEEAKKVVEDGLSRADHVHIADDALHFMVHSLTSPIGILALVTAILGIFAAWVIYQLKKIDAREIARTFKPLYLLFYNRWYFDFIYYAAFVYGYYKFSKILWFIGDKIIIDGIVDGSAKVSLATGSGLRLFQSGRIGAYVTQMAIGILIFLGIFLLFV
ncbi:NADH-quinone oxidoreductase subunit L [Persephonella sp.]|uniref:NADH-quinone oxidoreductase subunit L n=1 Tax=Persephonella sp. TaxID=2060922 RepID=UPI0025F79A3E|nr:NADH-quinone oxidoreductase subunit L [Persephonella sp.]